MFGTFSTQVFYRSFQKTGWRTNRKFVRTPTSSKSWKTGKSYSVMWSSLILIMTPPLMMISSNRKATQDARISMEGHHHADVFHERLRV